MAWRRRAILQSSVAAALLPLTGVRARAGSRWSGGRIEHLIPAANHERIVLKCVFADPVAAPLLHIANQQVEGRATDASGRSYAFHAGGLKPSTRYELIIKSGKSSISEPWTLQTFPAPDEAPEHVRLMVYTCAGGHPLMSEGEESTFLPMETRRRLLARGLSFQPDALIAIGDQLYWDQRTLLQSGNPRRRELANRLYNATGQLNRNEPAWSPTNQAILQVVAGEQITPLYGTSLRSTPSYFINDDHDYFENDEATTEFVTLPPYRYQRDFAAYVGNRYLPEFLRDPAQGPLSGDFDELNRSFGTLRWGNLCEVLMYDCAGHLSLKGASAGLVPPEVERWLRTRTADERTHQLLHVPSHPFGWSAGKWREWYPDVADTGKDGAQVAQMGVDGQAFGLTTDKPKFMWQAGWWQQHQRLLQSLAAQKSRPGIVLSGDLHATGHAQIVQSGDLTFSDNPVNTLITGPVGTGTAWPSRARGTPPVSATDVQLESPAPIAEKNGFTIVDVTPDAVRVRLFAWRRETGTLEAIDTMEPYHDVRISRNRFD